MTFVINELLLELLDSGWSIDSAWDVDESLFDFTLEDI